MKILKDRERNTKCRSKELLDKNYSDYEKRYVSSEKMLHFIELMSNDQELLQSEPNSYP